MKRITMSPMLRLGLRVDAVGSLGMGLGLLLLGTRLQPLYAIDLWLLLAVGVVCLVYGSAITRQSMRTAISHRLVACVVYGNTLWMLASLWLLATDLLAASTAGNRFILLQAMAVAGFIVLQGYGWYQSVRLAPLPELRVA